LRTVQGSTLTLQTGLAKGQVNKVATGLLLQDRSTQLPQGWLRTGQTKVATGLTQTNKVATGLATRQVNTVATGLATGQVNKVATGLTQTNTVATGLAIGQVNKVATGLAHLHTPTRSYHRTDTLATLVVSSYNIYSHYIIITS
jgi:hypothetical protein